MLRYAAVCAFLGATDLVRARQFFEGLLGLEVVSVDGFALVLRGPNAVIRVTQVERATHAPYTVLGWDVPDIGGSVAALSGRGLVFSRYPGLVQDQLGIWTAPSGSRIAWFQDPDENVLSIAQHPDPSA